MTETRKESLSALIDGEASEIEVHRLVREFRSDDGLSSTWAAYQHIRTTVRAEKSSLGPDAHRTLLQRISEAVDAEETHSKPGEQPVSSRRVVAGSLALAASLVVAVFIGVQKPSGPAPDSIAATDGAAPVSVQPVSTYPVGAQVASQAQEEGPTSDLVELDEEKQRLLRNYLNQHDRMSRMNDNQQFVNYQDKKTR